jgi:hypothetical protein
MDSEGFRHNVSDAIRFWEPMRVAYNLALAAIVGFYFVKGLPVSRQSVSFDGFLFLVLLAVLANVAYCAVYLVDVFVQFSSYRDLWRKNRWILFVVGVLFAAILARFWSMGMFPGPAH